MSDDGTLVADGAGSCLLARITLSRIGTHVPLPSSYPVGYCDSRGMGAVYGVTDLERR